MLEHASTEFCTCDPDANDVYWQLSDSEDETNSSDEERAEVQHIKYRYALRRVEKAFPECLFHGCGRVVHGCVNRVSRVSRVHVQSGVLSGRASCAS